VLRPYEERGRARRTYIDTIWGEVWEEGAAA
jgi:hypothetical protein